LDLEEKGAERAEKKVDEEGDGECGESGAGV
jgi:hypothetical protein